MKLSIYPEANFLPKSKQDKIKQGILASSPNIPEIVEVNNDEDLIKYVTSYAWSPSVFSGSRLNDNFVSADFMTLDIDSGMTIQEAELRVQNIGLAALCLPSPSYTPDQHKFRLVFPLAKTILSQDDFDATWDWLQEQFPELDRQCSDAARFYCCSTLADGFWQDGEFLVPKKAQKQEMLERNSKETFVEVPDNIKDIVKLLYGKERERIPSAVEFFLTNAHTGLSGLWISSLNACTFSLALSGVDDIIIEEVMESLAPEPLDSKDLYQIKRAIRDGKKARETL